MIKELIDNTDKQITLAQEAMLTIQRAKDSGEIGGGMADILITTQRTMVQLNILESQILKEVKKDG